jgi:hypothetical protein
MHDKPNFDYTQVDTRKVRKGDLFQEEQSPVANNNREQRMAVFLL